MIWSGGVARIGLRPAVKVDTVYKAVIVRPTNYIAGKAYTQWEKDEMSEDIRVESLNDDQMRDLT
jgi:hypothetical protein